MRPYLPYQGVRFSAGLPPRTVALLVVTIGVFVLQFLARVILDVSLEGFFGLSVTGLIRGQLWQFVTYMFLHGNALHLLLNMLMLLFLGAEVERAIGGRHFLVLYFLSGLLGGLGWLMVTYPYEGICVGASGAIFGLLSAYAALYPHRDITFLLFLVLPITVKAWVLAAGLAVVQLLFMMSPAAGGIAYAAHLAGALAGLVYTLTVFRPDVGRDVAQGLRSRFAESRRARASAADQEQRAEVDRLLDKVANQGLQSLTPRERRLLDDASARLRSRPR